ncbi:MAG: hypothetical protein JXC32_18010, partial [Anaerolineae bacterium]|nr:hypothetical protein [Anaerolineae bacterium]
PLGIFFLRNPDTFLTRIAQVAAPSWRDAFDGVWRCLQALVWPGAGDGYIRFNAPGAPVMRPVAAVLALLGLIRLLSVRRTTALEAAGRLLVVAGGLVMILPSALATGEITPSNLRMVGIYPFLAVLPAWGLHTVLQLLPASWSLRRPDSRARFPSRVHLALLTALLLVGAALTAWQYRDWAASGALFQAADGEMTLAAAALDAAVGPETTVYVASEHYRHPTVAALAMRYADAKWLTGGATLVLPPAGDAVTIVPDSQRPPAPWPAKVAALGEVSRVRGPAGDAGVTVTHLSAAGVAASRAELRAGEPVADFAHVVWVHSAAPATLCRAGEPCPMLVAWEPRAPYSALQPVVRFLHTETGEWARTMAFHYPSEQWTPGELVLDQLLLALPVEMPPGGNYRIGVGFFDPDREEALPRLVDERYAGSEVRFPLSQPGIAIVPATAVPSPAQVAGACPGVPRSEAHIGEALSLLGAQVMADATLLPGSPLTVRLCWQALAASPAFDTIMLLLSSTGSETVLFAGAAAPGYGFERWRAGEVIETRHPVRIPRDLPAGDYALTLQLDEAATTVGLDTLSVAPLARRFAAPETANAIDASFSAASGELIRLVGYELFVDVASDGLGVTLVWQALAAMEEDYVVFLHLRDAASDALIVQVDEMPQSPDATAAVRYPTSLWMPGEVITDRHTLALPEVPLSGAAYLYVGLYLPEDGTHLTVAGVSRLQLASFPEALLE